MDFPEPPTLEPRQLRLKEVRLPAGDVAPFDVDSSWNNGANRGKYFTAGYDGIRFIGRGRGLTHIRPQVGASTSSHSTVVIGRLAKYVWIDDATVHPAPNANGNKCKGIHVGDADGVGPLVPITLKLRNVEVVSQDDQPTTWPIFTYGTFEDYEHVTFNCPNSYEHADYAHGSSPSGRHWVDVEVLGSGAENSKGVCRPGESIWVPNAWYVYKHCKFANWYNVQSWQGGGGLVLQGIGANVLVEECEFRAPKEGHAKAPVHQRGRCLMLSDTGSTQYSAVTGEPAEHPGLGWVIIRRCLLEAGPGSANFSVMLRVGSENEYRENPIVARGILIEECGIYGERMLAQIGRTKGPTIIRGNNTPVIKSLAEARGFDTTHQCMYSVNSGPLKPFSEGMATG